MEDGTIILADNNNNKLKRLHKYNYTVTDYCDLTEWPWRLCMINNTKVAVTVPSKEEVHFISIEGHMKSTNKIKTDFKCYGLAYANNNLYISDSKTSVYMYTLTGRKLIHVQFSKDPLGYTLFSDIQSLAVSKDAKRIYVADSYNGLIVMDNNGHVITSFKDEQLKFASCCYCTQVGSVLVSGNGSNNVLQFTSDGELIGEIIKFKDDRSNILSVLLKGIDNRGILSVCCNLKMTKMCTSRNADDNIEVYDI
jgi:outer membrane protein assembly factor BamB